MQTFMQSCDIFTHNTQNSLLLLIHVQVQCNLAITRNTCVNVCSLYCLNLFLKYKIGQTFVCVCVCVFWIQMLDFFLLRDVFESLKYWLDLWLSSFLDCIHFCVFLFIEKLFLHISTASRQLSTASYPSRSLIFLSRQKLMQSRSIEAFLTLFRYCSTNSQSIEKVSVCSIVVRSIRVLWPSTDS